jgi:hypothetical protein
MYLFSESRMACISICELEELINLSSTKLELCTQLPKVIGNEHIGKYLIAFTKKQKDTNINNYYLFRFNLALVVDSSPTVKISFI